MKIGIFSGSFNPIHIGHIILANYITEFTDIDEVWLLVTPQNPFKKDQELADEDARLEMVRIATGKYPKLKASDFEFKLSKPSYTINTLKELEKAYLQHTFSLIIGADNWLAFDKWKDSKEIIDNYHVCVYPRLNYGVENIDLQNKYGVNILNAPVIEISSTFIRESIYNNKNIEAFLPENVYSYILKKRLYKD